MADEKTLTEKVLCSVCSNPAVKKRVYCSDCCVWSHISCYNKRKCCDTAASATAAILEINPDEDASDKHRSNTQLSPLRENSIIKDATKEQRISTDSLCLFIKDLLTKNSELQQKLYEERRQAEINQQRHNTLVQQQFSLVNERLVLLFNELETVRTQLKTVSITSSSTALVKNLPPIDIKRQEIRMTPHEKVQKDVAAEDGRTQLQATNKTSKDNDLKRHEPELLLGKQSKNEKCATQSPTVDTITTQDLSKPRNIFNVKSWKTDQSPTVTSVEAIASETSADVTLINKNGKDGFKVVTSQKRRKSRSIIGTGGDKDTQNFSGVEKKLWFCIRRTHPKTQEENILEYLRKNSSDGITFTCEKVESKSQYPVFKVSAPFSEKERIYDSGFWPPGVQVSRFYFPRSVFTETKEDVVKT